MKTKTKVINFFAGSGAGKSTTATGLFSKMKLNGILCEYVSEYAKDVTWEKTHALLDNQLHVFSEQHRRQLRLVDQVDYIITDSPLLLSSVYFDYYRDKCPIKFSSSYGSMLSLMFDYGFREYDNINFFIERNKPYVKVGRNQEESEAREIDGLIRAKLDDLRFHYTAISSTEGIEQAFRTLFPATYLTHGTTKSVDYADYTPTLVG